MTEVQVLGLAIAVGAAVVLPLVFVFGWRMAMEAVSEKIKDEEAFWSMLDAGSVASVRSVTSSIDRIKDVTVETTVETLRHG
jgi:hypothetical protein